MTVQKPEIREPLREALARAAARRAQALARRDARPVDRTAPGGRDQT